MNKLGAEIPQKKWSNHHGQQKSPKCSIHLNSSFCVSFNTSSPCWHNKCSLVTNGYCNLIHKEILKSYIQWEHKTHWLFEMATDWLSIDPHKSSETEKKGAPCCSRTHLIKFLPFRNLFLKMASTLEISITSLGRKAHFSYVYNFCVTE